MQVCCSLSTLKTVVHQSILSLRWYSKSKCAWLVYRHLCDLRGVNRIHQLSLLKFSASIASALTTIVSRPRALGRPRSTDDDSPAIRRRCITQTPVKDSMSVSMILDTGQNFARKKSKCRQWKTGTGRVYCKCNLCLCLNNSENCFYDFYQK